MYNKYSKNNEYNIIILILLDIDIIVYTNIPSLERIKKFTYIYYFNFKS